MCRRCRARRPRAGEPGAGGPGRRRRCSRPPGRPGSDQAPPRRRGAAPRARASTMPRSPPPVVGSSRAAPPSVVVVRHRSAAGQAARPGGGQPGAGWPAGDGPRPIATGADRHRRRRAGARPPGTSRPRHRPPSRARLVGARTPAPANDIAQTIAQTGGCAQRHRPCHCANCPTGARLLHRNHDQVPGQEAWTGTGQATSGACERRRLATRRRDPRITGAVGGAAGADAGAASAAGREGRAISWM